MDRRTPLCALAVAGALLAGCGGYGDICEAWMGCRGGNQTDIEACVAYMDSREERSENNSCDDRWDALVECVEENLGCQGETMAAETACVGQAERWNGCTSWSFFQEFP